MALPGPTSHTNRGTPPMTAETARTAANLTVAGAAIAAACLIVTTPRLRRLASTAIRVWLGASLPVYVIREVRGAWAETEPPRFPR